MPTTMTPATGSDGVGAGHVNLVELGRQHLAIVLALAVIVAAYLYSRWKAGQAAMSSTTSSQDLSGLQTDANGNPVVYVPTTTQFTTYNSITPDSAAAPPPPTGSPGLPESPPPPILPPTRLPPTPPPTPPPTGPTIHAIQAGALADRPAGTNVGGKNIGVVPAGASLTLLGGPNSISVKGIVNHYYEVVYNDIQGWVNGKTIGR